MVPGTPHGLASEKCWEDRAKTLNFCNPRQSWPSLPALVGLHNSNMAFSEILIRDGQTRGKKIRNPFALIVGVKQSSAFFLPPCYFSLQCRLCSSRFQQDWDAGLPECCRISRQVLIPKSGSLWHLEQSCCAPGPPNRLSWCAVYPAEVWVLLRVAALYPSFFRWG